MVSTNELLSETLVKFAQTKEGKSVSIAYVDTHYEGELLKHTFDIDVVPSVRLLNGDKVHALKWVNGLWTVDNLSKFVSGGYESAAYDYKRSRVSDGILLSLEYVITSLTD